MGSQPLDQTSNRLTIVIEHLLRDRWAPAVEAEPQGAPLPVRRRRTRRIEPALILQELRKPLPRGLKNGLKLILVRRCWKVDVVDVVSVSDRDVEPVTASSRYVKEEGPESPFLGDCLGEYNSVY